MNTITSHPFVAPLLRDDFTGTNGDLVINRPQWDLEAGVYGNALVSGSAIIQNNQMIITSDYQAVLKNIGNVRDISIEMDWTPAVGFTNRNTIVYNFLDSSNHGTIQIREDNGDINVTSIVNGASQTLHFQTFLTYNEGQTYHFRVDIHGNTRMKIFMDGVLMGDLTSFTDVAYESGTYFGVSRNRGSNETTIDNFVIRRLF